ncbi:MAG TPA: radical SAM protein [Candidatus Azoamicus sp. MARI]
MLQLNDLHHRYFSYIRLSVTDLCNFNCKYCLPYKNIQINKYDQLSTYEIYNLMNVLSDLGIKKIRLTGGEPTVRKDFLDICKIISSFKNIQSLVLTTNGYSLNNIIKNVYKTGVNGINISLDTLNDIKFYNITNKKYFNKVYAGILKSLEFDLDVKLNIVLSDFFSLSDFETFYSLIKYKKISIRLISQMETNEIKKNVNNLKMEYIITFLKNNNWQIEKKFSSDGPALNFKHNLYYGNIGVINPYLKTFCSDCNRLRISSNGYFFLCLFGHKGYYIKNLLHSSKKNDLKVFLINKIKLKLNSHFLNDNNFGLIKTFSSIGG